MAKGTQGAVKVTTLTTVELTPLGAVPGVEYASTSDGRFAVLFTVGAPAPDTTKYGTPAFHFGGRGVDRPVFVVGSANVAVNPGTLSIVPDAGAKAGAKADAKAAKLLSTLDPSVLASLAKLAGTTAKVEG